MCLVQHQSLRAVVYERGNDLASGKLSGVTGTTGKIAGPISPAVMRPLGPIPMRPLRVISGEDTSPETDGESCTRFPCVFDTKLGCNECKQSPYKIKTGELSVTKLIIEDFSKRAWERDGHGRNGQRVDRNEREQSTTRSSTSMEREVDTWDGKETLLAGHSRNSRTTTSDSSPSSNPTNRPPHVLRNLSDLQR